MSISEPSDEQEAWLAEQRLTDDQWAWLARMLVTLDHLPEVTE